MHSALHALPVLQDNVIWIWVRGKNAVVVDPAVAKPVSQWLNSHGMGLTAILQTHHHADHIGGTPELLREWPQAEVVAATADRLRIPVPNHRRR
jgi:hydroxyacylglutathione hydrolase